jgi:shikimate dehydrogenase
MSTTFHLGLTGWPLAHSFSPRLHQAALQACKLSGEYSLYPIPPMPTGQAELAALLERLRRGELDGLNITIPHKQAALPLLDKLTPTAQAAGAVNTLYRDGQQLVGENTDVPGFLEDLALQFALPEQGEALVLGAGGAARACVYALACRRWQVYLAARQPEQAQQLVNDFSHLTPAPLALAQPLAEAARAMSTADVDLLVNTTPLGMQPYEHVSPWPNDVSLPSGCLVYDLVYSQAETPLMHQARQQGLPAANGLGMLIHQAALSFLRWTGLPTQNLPAVLQAMHSAV